ncbi:hypothetical protein AOLI_G00029190 [Acnodon oligacanthus]
MKRRKTIISSCRRHNCFERCDWQESCSKQLLLASLHRRVSQKKHQQAVKSLLHQLRQQQGTVVYNCMD